jgi:hypothetical protein
LFPLEQPSFSKKNDDHFRPYTYTNNANFWQHEDDTFADLFQPPRVDLLQHSHGNFQPYPMRYDTNSSENLELFYEDENLENFQPCLHLYFGEHSRVKSLLEHSYGVFK